MIRLFRDPAPTETVAQVPFSELTPNSMDAPWGGNYTGEEEEKKIDPVAPVIEKLEEKIDEAEKKDEVKIEGKLKVEEKAEVAEEVIEEVIEDNPEAFYEAVAAITGEEIAVDYGEIDPLTPAGVAIRDAAIRADEVEKWENHLKTEDPRGYAYILHRQTGGTDESFFAQRGLVLPELAELSESVELQSDIYRQSLIAKGVPEDVADTAVERAIKDNKLMDRAKDAYTTIRADQENQLKQIEEANKQEHEAFVQRCANVTATLDNVVDAGELNFVVPETKKLAFKEFVSNSLRHEGGKFYAVSELDGKNTKEVMNALYFQFIKGDLNGLVARKAETKAVQRLKLATKSAAGGLLSSKEAANPSTTYVPFGSI